MNTTKPTILTGSTAMTRANDNARETFLKALAETGVVGIAAKAAGIHRTTAYQWKNEDPTFAALWQAALDDAIDLVENAAFVRAKDRSDRLVSLILKSHRRDTYGDKLDVTSGGQPIDLSWPEHKEDEYDE